MPVPCFQLGSDAQLDHDSVVPNQRPSSASPGARFLLATHGCEDGGQSYPCANGRRGPSEATNLQDYARSLPSINLLGRSLNSDWTTEIKESARRRWYP